MDDYLKTIKNSIEKRLKEESYINDETLWIMNDRLDKYLISKQLPVPIHKYFKAHVALKIKMIGERSSHRYLAEIAFPEEDSRHGLQMDGRDLKRWAAFILGELFTDKAFNEKMKDYWHE